MNVKFILIVASVWTNGACYFSCKLVVVLTFGVNKMPSISQFYSRGLNKYAHGNKDWKWFISSLQLNRFIDKSDSNKFKLKSGFGEREIDWWKINVVVKVNYWIFF